MGMTSTIQKMRSGLVTTTGNILVAGDFHIPQHDISMVQMLIQTAMEYNITTLVLNGDFVNQDVFSMFDRKQGNAGWEREVTDCRFIMGLLQRVFPHIVWVLGNHDCRMMKLLKYTMSFDQMARILVDNYDPSQIHVTDWDHCIHNGTWRISHPHEYSRRPTAKASAFAIKYGMNTIVGHSHMLNHSYENKDRKSYHYIDGGCCCDIIKVEYSQMNTSSFPEWKQGYVMLTGNEPKIISPEKPRKVVITY
jgi:predicted phosphodiesterase